LSKKPGKKITKKSKKEIIERSQALLNPYLNKKKVDVKSFIGQTIHGLNPTTKKREDFCQPQV